MEFTAEAAEYLIKLALIVASIYLALHLYMHRRRSAWIDQFNTLRLSVLSVLTFAVAAMMVAEKVLDHDSAPLDKAILLYLHSHVPLSLRGFFEAVTLSGSSNGLLILSILVIGFLLLRRWHAEALLMLATMICAPLTIYVLKALVDRQRPALWETAWYWGSSFPSGHTLGTTAFASACTLCVLRVKPAWHTPALIMAMSWICLVGLSRMVLGVHWPTDVLAAGCIGAFIPIALNMAIEVRQHRIMTRHRKTI
jgi:undecaprenyl-diphosphatase